MNAEYLSREQLLPAPEIRPSHGNTVKYIEVIGGKGRIVIPQYPGISIGHKIYWSVKGHGAEYSVITVEKLEPSYEAVLKFDIVFDSESVVASYFVMLDDEVLGYSHESPYTVSR
ncbi:hypothetical protein [Pseudomonas marginalis]|uniref:hypothetical protein n=1 Tax=Pseudomonas marginalis TaxID=298 RepID=UPI002B1CAEBC|nr:hypothetical protein [Pseudomonas marginalis]